MKLKCTTRYMLIGGTLGFFIIHPLVMIASHAMFEARLNYDHAILELILYEIRLAFSVKMLVWKSAFTVLGAFTGYLYGKVKQEERELREANATKDKFLSILAHDLKSPFNTLLVLLNLLHDNYDTLDEEVKTRYIRKSYEASERFYHLLEDVLEWSSMQTGKIQWKPEKIDLSGLAFETFALLKAQAEEKQIMLHLGIRKHTMVYADARMVMLVLRNVVSNAIKFTHPGGEVQITSKNGGRFEKITITDNGIGIRETDIPKLFKIDVPHSTSGTANEQGTGLGLALCKEFVEKHGGRIWVESEVGKGSCFTFSLPRMKISPGT